jgi:hypothetical protein
VLSALLYASETWRINKEIENQLPRLFNGNHVCIEFPEVNGDNVPQIRKPADSKGG